MRGVNRFGSMAAFAGHRTGGGGGEFLKKWKEKGVFDAWLHTKVLPIAIWRHGLPQLVVVEDRKTKTKIVHVWSKNLVCHETEDVLEGQYFRDKGTNERKHPPKRCGICKLVEWCYQQALTFEEFREENDALIAEAEKIEEKKPKAAAALRAKVKGIRFTEEMFKFEGDDAKETQIVHLGGLCNLFNKDMNDAQKKDMADAKISAKFAWKENAMAKCQYAMCVVNNDHPDDGVQIAVEASSLGDRVKGVLMKVLEEDERNIETDPYVIRWKFHKDAPMNEMYDALPMRKLKPTPRIMKLIKGDAPTDALDKLTERFNQQTVRAMLEKHCLEPIKSVVPWDEIFPTDAQEKKWAEEDAVEEAEAAELAKNSENDDRAERSRSKATREPGDDSEEDEDEEDDEDEDEELFECDNPKCLKPVKASDAKCPHCGHKYDAKAADVDEEEEEEEEEEEKPKKLPSRAEVLAAKKAAAAAPPKKTAAASKPKKDEEDEEPDTDDNQDDQIPF